MSYTRFALGIIGLVGVVLAGLGLPGRPLSTSPLIARDGETVELGGTIAFLEGLDIQERPIVYMGLRLDSPVTFTDGVDEQDDVGVVKLITPGRDLEALRKYDGVRVRVKGKVLYRWYGPSAAPLSTMVVVEGISGLPK